MTRDNTTAETSSSASTGAGTGALSGIRITDLSRVLAGPFCTQILGDLGAEIIKVEKPGSGDDTRSWGPPFLQDSAQQNTTESAYYLSCNRNKKSIAIDMRSPEGQNLVYGLIDKSDVVIENFKVGSLKKLGLDYESVSRRNPQIIYASITGFGQNGPLAQEPGYDFLAQAMSGLMACTGGIDAPPTKAGVALSDIITGLNAAIGILAALHHRKTSGQGQHIDVSLLDCTLAAMTNIAQYYLTSGTLAPRVGNAHSTIVPYQAFAATDGHLILAIGNDGQFARFCAYINKDDWAQDERFKTNSARVQNRSLLIPMIEAIIQSRKVGDWVSGLLEVDVPCGPVNTMDQAFQMQQVKAREMQISMPHPLTDTPINLVGNPIKMSATPPRYDLPPPPCGMHTRNILRSVLHLSDEKIAALVDQKIIA
ncbi:MAG: CaiB/BaiF CoA transferase family protein [Alphaproteobacteria bacterium]